MEDNRETICSLCAVGCRLAPGAEGSRAVGREGPVNTGGRLCRKGIHALEGIPDDERLTAPLVRRDGSLEPASWTAAYDRVISGIERAVERHGPDTLAFLGAPHSTTEENYLLGKLARTLGTNNVDNRARLCHVSSARALSDRLGWPASTNGLADLRDAAVILVVGANPAERQPIAFNSYVRPAVNAGATLIHVDPVGNETTRLADVHLAPRPDTDGLVLDLLCAAVLDAGGVDRSFVEMRTSGTDRFVDELAALDRAAFAEAAGVEQDAVERVAETISDADGMAAIVGTGIETDEREPSAADSLLNLLLLTGNVGRPGAGLHVFRGLSNEQGATDAGCVPDRLPGHQPLDDPEARTRIEREWGVAPPETPGRTAHELLAAFGQEIHCALVVGENPGVSKRDPDWIGDRLGGLDTLAVVELTESETTRNADVVLPAAAPAEKRGTMTNLDRRIQPLQAVREPPASARTDFEILRTIGAEFGEFEYEDPGDAFAELCAVAPPYRGIEYPEPGEQGARWPAGSGRVLYREAFRTPDGRAPLVSPAHRPESTPGSGLELVGGGRATDASSAGEEGQVRLHPADAADRDVADGDRVRVATGGAAVEGVAVLDDAVRQGTVSMHATLADPLVRAGVDRVSIELLAGASGRDAPGEGGP